MIKDFDYLFYINYYEDLKKNNINNLNKALKHYTTNGINENRYYANDSLSKVNISLEKNKSKNIDSILSAIKFSDKTICFDHDDNLTKKIKDETQSAKQLSESNHNFIKIPNSPSFSDWKEIVSTFHKNLVEF